MRPHRLVNSGWIRKCIAAFGFTILCVVAKAQTNTTSLENLCDTISEKRFFNLTKKVFKELDSFSVFPSYKKKIAIKIYNTTYLLENLRRKQRKTIKDYQEKFHRNFNVITERHSISFIGKNSVIKFSNPDIALLNKHSVILGEYRCSDIYVVVKK